MKELAKLFKALSHETRLTIMVLLSKKELCVCEIEQLLNISQVKVSRHLAVLKNAGLVTDRRDGFWIYYSVAKPENVIEIKVFELFKELAGNKEMFNINSTKIRSCIALQSKKKAARKGGN